MDLDFDDETEEFRAEVRDFLAANKSALPDQVVRHRRGFRAASTLGQGALRRRPVGDRLAQGVRRPRRHAAAVDRLRGGVLPRRRARPGQRQRHVDAGADAVRARHRGAARPGAAEDGQRRGDLGAGLVGARVGQRPGVAALDGHQDRRRLEAQRPEDLELASSVRRQGIRAVPVRPRGAAPQGPDLLHVRPEGRRRHRPADRAARRRHRVRRDLPRRRVRARRRRHRRACTTAGARR